MEANTIITPTTLPEATSNRPADVAAGKDRLPMPEHRAPNILPHRKNGAILGARRARGQPPAPQPVLRLQSAYPGPLQRSFGLWAWYFLWGLRADASPEPQPGPRPKDMPRSICEV